DTDEGGKRGVHSGCPRSFSEKRPATRRFRAVQDAAAALTSFARISPPSRPLGGAPLVSVRTIPVGLGHQQQKRRVRRHLCGEGELPTDGQHLPNRRLM